MRMTHYPFSAALLLALTLSLLVPGSQAPGNPGEVTTEGTVEGEEQVTFDAEFKAGQVAVAKLQGDGSGDMDLYVYDENGQEVASNLNYVDRCSVCWVPERTGRYTLKVQNLEDAQNRYTVTRFQLDERTKMTSIQARVDAGGSRRIQVDFEAGKVAVATIRGNGSTDLDLAIYDPTGRMVEEDINLVDRAGLAWEPPQAGRYVIEVRNLGETGNTYTLSHNGRAVADEAGQAEDPDETGL